MDKIISGIYCRVFQAGMKGADYFLGYRMPDYLEGAGCLKRLPALICSKGADQLLVVTDPNLVKLGLASKLTDLLDQEGLHYTVFSGVEPNPTSDNVEAGFRVYQEHGCRALVALGGGAPIDCAKAIAAKSVHPHKTVAQLQGILKVHAKIPLLFAIPTTAGTGSETTVAAVIIDSATHHKASINDPVEAYTNHTYNTELEDFLAREAVRLIHDNLLKAYHDGNDLEARGEMQKAAFFAGRAFTRGCVGYVHAVGHTLGGLYGVPHGLAMSIILPHVMRQYGPAVYDSLSELADVCGIEGRTNAEKAHAFISWIEEMKTEMQIPVGADMIQEKDIPQIITWAMEEANPLYPTPVTWGYEDFEKLIAELRKENA